MVELLTTAPRGHNLSYLYEPLIKVPLIIFEPGQTQRRDIRPYQFIDLLPTLLDYTNHQIPSSLPGRILLPFSKKDPILRRQVYALHKQK